MMPMLIKMMMVMSMTSIIKMPKRGLISFEITLTDTSRNQ
jgi:hypothetical protein